MFQELLRKSSIDCAKCQSGGAFDELNIFNRRQRANIIFTVILGDEVTTSFFYRVKP